MSARPSRLVCRSTSRRFAALRPCPHISLVISGLGPGGAERVLTRLAHHLAARSFRLSVITLAPKNGAFYPLPLAAHWIGLGVEGVSGSVGEKIGANLRRVKFLRQVFDRLCPDVIVSFLTETNILVLIACLGRTIPVIVTEHSNPRILPSKGIWRMLRRLVYPFGTRLVSVSPGVDSYFGFLPASKRRVIPNPIPVKEIFHSQPMAEPLPWSHAIFSMGRVEPEKNFDQLIAAAAPLLLRHPDWGLVVVGEGSQRAKLQEQACAAGVADRLLLPGAIEPPYPMLKRGDIFAFPSQYEGFGLAAVEAMACGLPVVASACRPGPGEIITHGVDGLLFPPNNLAALRQVLELLMQNPDLRRRLGEAGQQTAKEFDISCVMPRWDALIQELLPPVGSPM